MPDSVSLSSLLGPALGVIAAYFVLLAIAYRLGSGTAFAKAFLKSSTPPASRCRCCCSLPYTSSC